MKKVFFICALLCTTAFIGTANEISYNSEMEVAFATRPSEPTNWSEGVTNPNNPSAGLREQFTWAKDSEGVVWVYGTRGGGKFSNPIRTVPSDNSNFRYKFMWRETVWYLA